MQVAPTTPLWNSLEIVRLVLGFITPLFVVVMGTLITKSLRGLESRLLVSQKIVEKRLALFDSMAPLLNDLYTYFLRVVQ